MAGAPGRLARTIFGAERRGLSDRSFLLQPPRPQDRRRHRVVSRANAPGCLFWPRAEGCWTNLDIFVPQTQVYTALELVEEEAYTRARKANKQVWYYSSGVFDGPHGLDSDVELPAMRSRLLVGTVAFAHKVDGFLYYR